MNQPVINHNYYFCSHQEQQPEWPDDIDLCDMSDDSDQSDESYEPSFIDDSDDSDVSVDENDLNDLEDWCPMPFFFGLWYQSTTSSRAVDNLPEDQKKRVDDYWSSSKWLLSDCILVVGSTMDHL